MSAVYPLVSLSCLFRLPKSIASRVYEACFLAIEFAYSKGVRAGGKIKVNWMGAFILAPIQETCFEI